MVIGMNKSFFKAFYNGANLLSRLNFLNRVKHLEKIIFTSIPKCGTHLLLRYLSFGGFKGGLYKKASTDKGFLSHVGHMKKGDYCAFHYRWTEELSKIIKAQRIKVVFLYRDPRAQMYSELHWAIKRKDHRLHFLFTQHLKTNEERMIRLIKGISQDELSLVPELPDKPLIKSRGINLRYQGFAPWLKDSSCYSVRYEDIVGPKGGGSSEKQLQIVRELMAFTGTPKGNLNPQEVADSLFDEHSNTFRKGQIDSWRKEFTPELHELFMQEAGGLLTQWGYAP